MIQSSPLILLSYCHVSLVMALFAFHPQAHLKLCLFYLSVIYLSLCPKSFYIDHSVTYFFFSKLDQIKVLLKVHDLYSKSEKVGVYRLIQFRSSLKFPLFASLLFHLSWLRLSRV